MRDDHLLQRLTRFSVLVALVVVTVSAGPARADDAILVLDASGSMWGKIEGKTKVEIARSVIGEILDELPPDRSLGLVAYGHRRDGDCSDIEQVVPVGKDRAAIRTAVGKMNFKGKTPLSAAVRFAAEKLHYKEQKATVILVSDGAENCGIDPCALGRELEATGVHFTAHIIGFGLASETESAGLRCLAQATGGRYVGAKNARELTAALAETVAAPAEAPPKKPDLAHVTLRATELDGGPEITSGLVWEVKPAGGAAVFSKSDGGVEQTDVPPGSYDVRVSRAADGLKGATKLDARAGGERTVTVPLEFDLKAALTLTPAAAAAGSKVSVAWTGPNRKGDYVTVVKTGAATTDYLDYRNTENGNPLEITMPAEPGKYEMRYVLGTPQRVLASVPIEASAVAATLEAPPAAPAGTEIEIAWTGPNYAGDWITVVKRDAPPSAYGNYLNANGDKKTLTLPIEAGSYEIRYVQDGKVVLARRPLTIAAVTATLTAPADAVVGSSIDVAWTGPNGSGDWITIVRPDAAETTYNDYFDTAGTKHALEAPVEPGSYELRYVQGGQKILARRPITLTAATAAIAAPASAKPEAEFEISWTGPNNAGDWLTIVLPSEDPTTYRSYVDANRGSPAKLTAPSAAGTYELRYVLRGKSVIARKTIDVR